ncbi:MAG TPA: glycosyl hydrolase [Actinotalea sp.]
MSENTHVPARHWWTARGLSPRAKLGTGVVAALLVVVTLAVWTSPGTAAAPVVSAQDKRLADQMAELQQRLGDREAELADRDAQISALTTSQRKAAQERAAGAASGQAKAAAEKEAAAAGGSTKAKLEREAAAEKGRATGAAQRAAAAERSRELAAARAAAATARGRAAAALAEAQRARAAATAAKAAQASAKPSVPTAKPSAPSLSALIAPTKRQFGLYTAQSPFNWAEHDDITRKVGTSPTMVGYFQGWDSPFRPDAVTRAWQRGMMPLLTWESQPGNAGNDQAVNADYSLPVIIGDPANGVPGRYDDYLHQYARDIAALGLPLAIRLDHEMNGSWYPWGERAWGGNFMNGNRKGDYVAMWRHVHDIFEQEGANQYVMWIWAPNIVNSLPDYGKYSSWYMNSLYPGDDYVDWVGLSGYYRPPYRADQTPTFQYTFDRSLAQLREVAPGKPILLAEIGASEIGNNKPAWVTSLFESLALPQYSDIVGFAWFHHTVTTISGGQRVTNDWRIDSRRDSLDAFIAGISNPAAGFVAGAPGAGSTPDPVPSDPVPSPTPTEAAGPSPSPSASPTPEPSASPEPSGSPTPEPSASPTPEPSASPTPEPSASPSAEPTAAPSPEPSPAPEPSASP